MSPPPGRDRPGWPPRAVAAADGGARRFQQVLAAELAGLQDRLLAELPQARPREELDATRWSTPSKESRKASLQSSSPPLHLEGTAVGNWHQLVSKLVDLDDDIMHAAGLMITTNLAAREVREADEDFYSPHPGWFAPAQNRVQLGTQNTSRFAASHMALGRKGSWRGSSMIDGDMYMTDTCLGRMMMHPDSRKRICWCLIGALILVFELTTIPLEAASILEWSSMPFVLFSLAYWTVDVCLQLLTGYSFDNHVEMRPSLAAQHYARTWMPLDVGVLFLDVGFLILHLNASARVLRIVRFFRILRFFRFHKWRYTVIRILRSSSSDVLDLVVKVGKLVILYMFACHYIACAWYGIAESSHDAVHWGVGGSWVEEFGVTGTPPLHCYAMALHWSITQFTPSTNNIVPVNTIERVFACGVVMFGMLAFSAFLSSVTSTINELKNINSGQTQQRHMLLQFIKHKQLPAKLGQEILAAVDQEGERNSRLLVEDDIPLLAQVPESLRIQMHKEHFMPLLKANDIFRIVLFADPHCCLHVSHEAMCEHRYAGMQEVFMDGVPASFAYVVASGVLQYQQRLLKEENRKPVIASTYTNVQDWLSEGALWMEWVHQGSLVACSACILVKVNCDALRSIVVQGGGPMTACLRCCAILFAHHLEKGARASGSHLSDVGLPEDHLTAMSLRALQFCKLAQRRMSGTTLSRDGTNSDTTASSGIALHIPGRQIMSKALSRILV